METDRPLVAITVGDAAGIGPEVVTKALTSPEVYRLSRPLVIASSSVMDREVALRASPPSLHRVGSASETKGEFGTIDYVDMANISEKDLTYGKISAACGKAAMQFIERAADLALSQQVKSIVTAPINKEATQLAGYSDVGHLEFLARLTGSKQYATMLVAGVLRAVHLTTHHALIEACRQVTRQKVLDRIELTQKCFKDWGFERPRIGVAALNPHGGEGGMMGREEIDEIIPAVKAAVSRGIDARGPFPADSIYNRAIGGEFDVVIAMYHDQGHIPIKVFGFEKSVSVALGLPFIRTSVDHGTAFDIAGKGVADARSMEEAIKVAVSLSERRRLA